MPRYRYAFVAAAMFTLGAVLSPGLGTVNAQDATPTDIAQQAADGARLAACATPVPTGDPVTVKGNGKTQTLPFDLAGGAYTVSWQVGQGSGPTNYSVRMMPVVDAPLNHGQTIWTALYNTSPDLSSETHLYDVKPGKYYLAVDVPKGWSVTFTPLAV